MNFIIIVIFANLVAGSEKITDGLTGRTAYGERLPIAHAPFMALYFNTKIMAHPDCGASIVSDQFLVTAAHCTVENYKSYVKVGTNTLQGGLIYYVQKVIAHPKYKDKTSCDCDIAVLKLHKRLKFNQKVQPIKLAPHNMVFQNGDMMRTMGFGETERSMSSSQLLKVDIPYVSQSTCIKWYKHLTNNMMCAGQLNGKVACRGDSGGPLVYRGLLVGVVSFGYGLCGVRPSVYARVPALRSFIDKAMKSNL